MSATEPQSPKSLLSAEHALHRAAAYVRMSTEHQQFSIENQLQVISEYARLRGAEIIRTYSDVARSGLTLNGRDALRQLISDVGSGHADFELILVYDVSRWGRFQNVDESAHYEFICRKAGVSIEYCADGFRNDGSIVAALIKGVKRAMAAELSRELSAKVFRAHLRLAQMGFHQGGVAGFGLRRVLVDKNGLFRRRLEDGEEKYLQEDRVVLVPGSTKDVQTVREVFRLYVDERLSQRRIAQILNEQGLRNGRGNRWIPHNVNALLRSERYVGNLVYNRTSIKLQSTRVSNPKHAWIRTAGAIETIIQPEVFSSAQARLNVTREISDNHLFDHLTAVWCVTGYLSCRSMKKVPNTPVPNTYQDRFGSLENAYRLLGYKRTRSYRYATHSALLRRVDRELICRLCSAAQLRGGTMELEPQVVRVDGETTACTVVLPHTQRKDGRAGWWLHFDRIPSSDLMLIVRMTESNTAVLDYHLLPFPLLAGPTFRFTNDNVAALATYRLRSPTEFYAACRKYARHDACR
jgi:DNA invertase Pin-like site-specific DNA recombinase